MARITVEDCLTNVDNRFDLVLLASRRARQLVNGVEPLVNDSLDFFKDRGPGGLAPQLLKPLVNSLSTAADDFGRSRLAHSLFVNHS